MNQNVLVNYSRPPVVETMLGFQFEPLPDFSNAFQGVFWAELGDQWPNLVDAPPLEPQFEQMAESSHLVPPSVAFRFAKSMSCRLLMRNKANDRLIQLQNGRLQLNWLGQDGASYPRFPTMLEEFRQIAERFVAFVASKGLGKLQPNQWEISYLNHIVQGTVWNFASDWGFFRPLAATKDIPTTVKFETFHGEWHFVIPPARGRLHVEWRHGKTQGSPKELIALNLTARGPIRPLTQNGEIDLPAIYDGLTVGHNTIVTSFRDFMSDAANEYWGKQ